MLLVAIEKNAHRVESQLHLDHITLWVHIVSKIFVDCWEMFIAGSLEKGKNQDFMLIRFFKENDLIGCDGDPQPIRLQQCM